MEVWVPSSSVYIKLPLVNDNEVVVSENVGELIQTYLLFVSSQLRIWPSKAKSESNLASTSESV